MKKTFLISLFLLFTSSVFAVSIPGGGLGTEEYASDDFFYFDGFGLRSAEQVGQVASEDNPWEGTWDKTGGGGQSAVDVMEVPPSEYAAAHKSDYGSTISGAGDNFWIEGETFRKVYDDIVPQCTGKGGKLLDCQNYAVDVYNLVIPYLRGTALGIFPTYKGYYGAPVSTDVALMALFAGAYLAFALWRKKRSVAKI